MSADPEGFPFIPDKLEDSLRSVGELIGKKLFDALTIEKNSPSIQKERKHYVKTMGSAFVVYIIIVSYPPLIYAYSNLLDWITPSSVSETTFYDLQVSVPLVSYEVYGASVIIAGSFYLSTKLFNNFIIEDVENGEVLAITHSGVIIVMTGLLFQLGGQYENELSSPGGLPFEQGIYFFFEHLGQLIPYLGILMLFGIGTLAYISTQYRASEQTTLNSERWK